ncbi:MAG: hypothetical protein VSS75_002705 [Candidatus Parabeggiatoa sp.]|nr:hypothetical protein [Candidatus Parabeggiatoa sp.]
MNISEQDSDIFWEVLRGKSAPTDANPKFVTMAKAFRNAEFPTNWKWEPLPAQPKEQQDSFRQTMIKAFTKSLENILLPNLNAVFVQAKGAKGNLASAIKQNLSQNEGLLYENDDHSELKCEEKGKEWVLSFKIIKGEPVTEIDGRKKVDLIIADDSTGEFLVEEEWELTPVGKMWAFRCYLPEKCTNNQISISVDYELLAN